VSAEAVRIVEQIQGVLDVDVVAALDDDETDRRIRQTLAELAQPDFEVAMVGPGYLPESLDRIGFEGFRDAWVDWTSPFESFRIEIERVIDAGDCVVSLVRQAGKTKTGGVDIEAAAAAVWTIRDGKLTRVEFHLDREAALRAAGLDS
jgi:ketosteroid isomerase-like protein